MTQQGLYPCLLIFASLQIQLDYSIIHYLYRTEERTLENRLVILAQDWPRVLSFFQFNVNEQMLKCVNQYKVLLINTKRNKSIKAICMHIPNGNVDFSIRLVPSKSSGQRRVFDIAQATYALKSYRFIIRQITIETAIKSVGEIVDAYNTYVPKCIRVLYFQKKKRCGCLLTLSLYKWYRWKNKFIKNYLTFIVQNVLPLTNGKALRYILLCVFSTQLYYHIAKQEPHRIAEPTP